MLSWFKKKKKLVGPSYAHVTSPEIAEELVNRNELVRMLLLPSIFGGEENINNIIYVPPFVLSEKDKIDQGIIVPLIRSDKVSQYMAKPLYDGKSVVPSKIQISATDPGKFKAEIKIWGSAIN